MFISEKYILESNGITTKLRNSKKFTPDLESEVMLSNNPNIFLLALGRKDCPTSTIINLMQCPDDRVRLKIAKHPNTPKSVLQRYLNDKNQKVVNAAKKRLKIK